MKDGLEKYFQEGQVEPENLEVTPQNQVENAEEQLHQDEAQEQVEVQQQAEVQEEVLEEEV